jgi:type II secretory pathway predicted ATPase ExeA
VPALQNPFRCGAGHTPPHLVGRASHEARFAALLTQEVVQQNLALPGLRGAGKTVLLDVLKDAAVRSGWTWIQGNGVTPADPATEDDLTRRLISDLSAFTSPTLGERSLREAHQRTPGLAGDRLVAVLRLGVEALSGGGRTGVAFAYDDAHHLVPTALLLEAFDRVQREGIRALLVLTGLPSLSMRLAEAGVHSRRRFTTAPLGPLSADEVREAVRVPLERSPVALDEEAVDLIVQQAAGHPYFVQFWSRGIYDLALQRAARKQPLHVPLEQLRTRLEDDVYVVPWERLTDRQKDMMRFIASLDSADSEFSIPEIQSALEGAGAKPLSKATIHVRLADLSDQGLVYKQRHGRYCLAVPRLGSFVRRRRT